MVMDLEGVYIMKIRELLCVFMLSTLLLCSCVMNGNKDSIAIIVNDENYLLNQYIVDGAEAECMALGYNSKIYNLHDTKKTAVQVLEEIEKKYIGIYIMDSLGLDQYTKDYIAQFGSRGNKVVIFNPYQSSQVDNTVCINQEFKNVLRMAVNEFATLKEKDKQFNILRITSYDDTKTEAGNLFDRYIDKNTAILIDSIYVPLNVEDKTKYIVSEIEKLIEQGKIINGVISDGEECSSSALKAVLKLNMNTPIISLGVSNDILQEMKNHPDILIGAITSGGKYYGVIGVRMLHELINDRDCPESYIFDTRLIQSKNLNERTKMSDLEQVILGWEPENVFYTDEIRDLHEKNLKNIVYVTNGKAITDNGFCEMVWKGINDLSYKANVSYIETSNESEFNDQLKNIQNDNVDLIWLADSSGLELVLKNAKENKNIKYVIPNTNLENCPKNVSCISFADNEGAFLAGYIAGKMSTTDKVGFIGCIQTDNLKVIEYGYKAGVEYANEETKRTVKVITNFVELFSEDKKAHAFANNMYDSGCDIIFQAAGEAGMGVIESAKDNDKFVIGSNYEQGVLAPDNVLISVTRKVGNAANDLAMRFLDGEKIGENNYVYGLKDNVVRISDSHDNIPYDVWNSTMKVRQMIIDKKISVPYDKTSYNKFVK